MYVINLGCRTLNLETIWSCLKTSFFLVALFNVTQSINQSIIYNSIFNSLCLICIILLQHISLKCSLSDCIQIKFVIGDTGVGSRLALEITKKGALDSQLQVIKFTSCLPMVGGSLIIDQHRLNFFLNVIRIRMLVNIKHSSSNSLKFSTI
jgi:hypothetical protein